MGLLFIERPPSSNQKTCQMYERHQKNFTPAKSSRSSLWSRAKNHVAKKCSNAKFVVQTPPAAPQPSASPSSLEYTNSQSAKKSISYPSINARKTLQNMPTTPVVLECRLYEKHWFARSVRRLEAKSVFIKWVKSVRIKL